MTTLQDRINERMGVMKLTNAQLAKAAGVKPPTSFNWANGRTKNIKGEPLLRAAKALGVTPEWLASGKGTKFPASEGANNSVREAEREYRPQREFDAWTLEAIGIFERMREADRRGALAVLRSYAQNLGPPSDGQALQMAVR
ncbi:hypothetical protein RD110_18720 [Rhodoferax koreense]|uniref:HTH cro/C1-type domain-containing protein n=1 Tax=Rhodoferax koreensis TaxID=1842727 RepID=A0A1P8JZ15_9BURK|nr:helix-turn-helix domain-containing protein [Rhodoferax koreense]APW38988.1 hypothetical protein RD110_18720 [Rhodoferax koreense]